MHFHGFFLSPTAEVPTLFYIHQMNWLSSHNDLRHDDNTINIVRCIIITIIIFFKYYYILYILVLLTLLLVLLYRCRSHQTYSDLGDLSAE